MNQLMTYHYDSYSLKIEPQCDYKNIYSIVNETEIECFKLMIMSSGKTLPSAFISFDTAHDKIILFDLDCTYFGEMMEINLFDIMLQHEKPKTDIMIICTRQTDVNVIAKEKRRINFNLLEHYLCMICIRGNEQITIESKQQDTKSKIICTIKFIVSD